MKKFTIVIGHIAAFFAVFAGISAITMLLWNALLPGIFGISAIGFWQAAGLLVLCKILFGKGFHHHGFGKHGKGRKKRKHWNRHPHDFPDPMHEMSREEKMEFIRRRMFGPDAVPKDDPSATDRQP